MPDVTDKTVVDEATTAAVDGLPATVPFSMIEDVLHAIGIDASECISLTFGIEGVTIERVRTMADGKVLAAGTNLATITTVIGYDRTHSE